jgi:hypothetical protein
MHANDRGGLTDEALPGILNALSKRGFERVTVADVLADPLALSAAGRVTLTRSKRPGGATKEANSRKRLLAGICPP